MILALPQENARRLFTAQTAFVLLLEVLCQRCNIDPDSGRIVKVSPLIVSAGHFSLTAGCVVQPYIDMVRRKLPSIARDIRASFPDSQLRVAFVGYRDYDDAQPLVVLDFRALSKRGGSVSNTFEAFLRELHATGGGDAAEDVFSGLEAVARLDWRSTNRVLVHIADAPCHGAEFHNGSRHPGFDDYPAGDRKGRDASKILRKLQRDAQISAWLFCHLTKSTYKMVARFKQILGEPVRPLSSPPDTPNRQTFFILQTVPGARLTSAFCSVHLRWKRLISGASACRAVGR